MDPDSPRPSSRRGADLHVHTTHSDGTCSPCAVVIAAAGVGLQAVAITDHDTVSGIAVARPEAERLGIELVPGVEWTADFEGRELHILGHFVNENDSALLAASARLRAGRIDRLKAMVESLERLGLSVDLEALARMFPRATLGRRHLAEWLARTGQVGGVREAFVRYLGDKGPARVPKPRLDWREAITLTAGAGGVSGLAHPPFNLREEAIETLAAGGLGAIEVEGPGINNRLGRRFLAWAGTHNLVPIAGSDFHAQGPGPRWVGAVTTAAGELERLRERCPGR